MGSSKEHTGCTYQQHWLRDKITIYNASKKPVYLLYSYSSLLLELVTSCMIGVITCEGAMVGQKMPFLHITFIVCSLIA